MSHLIYEAGCDFYPVISCYTYSLTHGLALNHRVLYPSSVICPGSTTRPVNSLCTEMAPSPPLLILFGLYCLTQCMIHNKYLLGIFVDLQFCNLVIWPADHSSYWCIFSVPTDKSLGILKFTNMSKIATSI